MPLKDLKSKSLKWQDYVLFGIIILSFFLNFWMLNKEGYSNEYYAAAVRSMLSNAKAFFYGSFDSGLYVTVDKPPLGLWVQALSVMVFGLNSFGLIFPSAFAGSMCALIVYSMVKKHWGDTTGIISAAIVSTTPILVALSRTNNMDLILLFMLLCGAKFILKAAEKQSLKYYIIAMIFLGLGFNVKMLQAYMVLPAFVLAYFFGKGKFAKKILHTIVAVVVLAGVSFSWALYVDSVPETERPYIGSSSSNSVFDLMLGYNGINRLTGQKGNGGNFLQSGLSDGDASYFNMIIPTDRALEGTQANQAPSMPTADVNNTDGIAPQMDGTNDSDATLPQTDITENSQGTIPGDGMDRPNDPYDMQDGQSSTIAGIMNQGSGGAGGEGESGIRGVFRFYTYQLAGLISWFLLPAIGVVVLAGVCCVYWFIKRKTFVITDENRAKLTDLVFWSAWLVPMAVFFSIAGFIHRYYVVMLTPAIAALAAISVQLIWNSKYKKWLVPVSLLVTLAVQCIIAARTTWIWILIPMLVLGVIGLVSYYIKREPYKKVAAGIMLISLFVAPLAWALTPVIYTNTNANIPNAGPTLAESSGRGGISLPTNNLSSNDSSALYKYLLENYNGERWAVAVASSNEAAPIILETGLPVMAIGGFSGSDSILTLNALKEYIQSGELRYYYASSNRGGQSDSEITTWVEENGTAIDVNGVTIYDLSGATD